MIKLFSDFIFSKIYFQPEFKGAGVPVGLMYSVMFERSEAR